MARAREPRRGTSVGEPAKGRAKKVKDPFWDNRKTFADAGPAGLSSRIDEIVYGGPR